MFNVFIVLAVVVSGASILAVEILGTRLLGPFYGVSLYLWSALIGITLAALAVGYAIGGRRADASPSMRNFCWPMGLAGLLIIAIPWLRHPVINLFASLDMRTGILISGSVLFFPPLALLGTVSPMAIRLKAASLDEVGRTAGNLYAISTLASVAAALGTGFYLVPHIGVARLTFLIGLLLVLTAALGLAIDRKGKVGAMAVLGMLLMGSWAYTVAPEAQARPDVGLLDVRQSAYAEIRVIEKNGLRFMLIDGGPHTIVDPLTWESDYGYVDVLELSKRFYTEPGRLLLVGLGGGSVAKVFHRDGWQVETVEIDPVVSEVALEWFGLEAEETKLHHMDGRQFLIANERPFELIILDAFGSSSIPFHLITKEAFALTKSQLATGGVLMLNLESIGWHDMLVHSVANTLGEVFGNVKVLPMEEPPDQFGNIIIVASDSPLEIDEESLPMPTARWSFEYNQYHAWENNFIVPPESGPVLTDDLNMVDLWSVRINLASRQQLHNFFGGEGIDW
jgi:spermidine synthase